MKRNRTLSLVLAAVMTLSTAVIPINAESEIQYTEADLHEMITYADAVAAGHVNRLNDEEDMNTLIFANEDNTKTMYYYGENIKYTDENGTVRDKTNELTYSGGVYVNEDNDINVAIPASLASGVTLTYEDIEITMTPEFTGSGSLTESSPTATLTSTPRGQADNVTYSSVFGSGISVRYTPMYSGIKEDIILSSYTGVYSFDFTIETNGLVMLPDTALETETETETDENISTEDDLNLSDSPNWYFATREEPTTPVAWLSEIYIYDSAGNTALGSVNVTQISQTEYALTVIADKTFLEAESTVYPVTVDPSVTIDYNNATIHDSSINGYFSTTNYGSATTLAVGGSYSSFAALKFYGLQNNSVFSSLAAGQIINATLNLRCISKGTSDATVYVNQYSPIAATSGWWWENTITYNSNGVAYVAKEDNEEEIQKTISTTGDHSFTITDIVKDWKGSTTLIEKGLLLRVSSSQSGSSYLVNFASSEHTTPYYRPYLEINYVGFPSTGYYKIKNGSTGNYLAVNGGKYADGKSVIVSPASTVTAEYEINGAKTTADVTIIDYYWRIVTTNNKCTIISLLNNYGYGNGLSTGLTINGTSAEWTFEYAGDNYWYIKNGSKCLMDNQGTLSFDTFTNAANQKWKFESQATFTRTVKVENTNGTAVSNATIQISATNMPERRQNYRTKTNSNGTVTLELLSGYYYGVNAVHSSYTKCYASSCFNSSGTTTVTVTVRSVPTSISGVFGKPFANLNRTSAFGWRSRFTSFTNISTGVVSFGIHKGVDYTGSDNILSISDGTVVKVQPNAVDSSGIYVTVRYTVSSSEYYDITYRHLASYSVLQGDTVTQGSQIGVMGTTSHPEPVSKHLHIDIKDNAGLYYDPEALLN